MNKYCILMMGYNSRPWIEKSLESALGQKHDNFSVIAIDAKTNDGTHDVLLSYEEKHDNLKVVRNINRQYQTQNVKDGVELAESGSIIVTLDFDDWLAHDNVLNVLDSVYNDDVWMTYGSYCDYFSDHQIYHHPRPRYSDDVVRTNSFRNAPWCASHLRTFRKELYEHIKDEDLRDNNGDYWNMAGDMGFMIPMLEMSGERFVAIQETLYVYNKHNPLSEDKIALERQQEVDRMIRSNRKYCRLEKI